MDSFDKLYQFALAKEEEAQAFYEFLASQVSKEHIRRVFLEMAGQEKAHKKVFEDIVRQGCRPGPGEARTEAGLHISEYLVDVPFDPGMSYQDALILGMKKEEKSGALYTDLALKVGDACLAETLRRLAGEEARHKANLEEIYEREVLTED